MLLKAYSQIMIAWSSSVQLNRFISLIVCLNTDFWWFDTNR